MPAIVREVNDESVLAFGILENLQRENLNAIEEAVAFQRLIEDFALTHEEASLRVVRFLTRYSCLPCPRLMVKLPIFFNPTTIQIHTKLVFKKQVIRLNDILYSKRLLIICSLRFVKMFAKMKIKTKSTKEKLDSMAMSLFIDKGIEGTSIRDIVFGIGLTEGAFYRHYKSKNDLIKNLFLGSYLDLSRKIEHILKENCVFEKNYQT